MNAPEPRETLFGTLVADLPDQHKAEFFRNLHEAGISPNDLELARLLHSLQLYKAYYESIPAAVQAAAAEIDRLKKEIERLAGQFIQEAERFHEGVAELHEEVDEVTRNSAESLVSRMTDLLTASLDEILLRPLKSRLAELGASNEAFDDAIERSKRAAATLRESAKCARRVHFGTYVLAAFTIACALTLASWSFLHRWYADRMERERVALVRQIEANRAVLLKLAESHRTLELLQDPEHPHRMLLVMKDAAGWQSTRNHGVIEFNK